MASVQEVFSLTVVICTPIALIITWANGYNTRKGEENCA